MKQVKGLIRAAILVLALGVGGQAGDMGSPGCKTIEGDTKPPLCPNSVSIGAKDVGETLSIIDLSNPLVRDIVLALLGLI